MWWCGVAEEIFEIVNEDGEVIGSAPRSECHGNPNLLHQVAHVLVFRSSGALVLQKRSLNKDIQPGKWDTSVGGHLSPGETPEAAAQREMFEELGIRSELTFCHRYIWRTEVESELVYTYSTTYDEAVAPDAEEIDEARAWTPEEIMDAWDGGVFTSNFKEEWRRYTEQSD
jgi:isopentenyldiphosphate isomerase